VTEPRPATLITGASAGLGALFARECAARGDEVILVARRYGRLVDLAETLPSKAHIYPADLSAPDAVDELEAFLKLNGLRIETLINNAGFGLVGDFAALPEDRQLEMIDLNVRVLTQLCRRALPPMIERRGGFILNVASTAAFQAGPNMAVYYATKAFVLSLTEALHQEAKGTGVHVTALCPGPTATEFFDVAGAGGGRLAKMATEPGAVVRAGLAGLARNRAVVVPGAANKIGAQAHRYLPRAAMRRIIARIKA
jgi:short-subunit dehydrogenase